MQHGARQHVWLFDRSNCSYPVTKELDGLCVFIDVIVNAIPRWCVPCTYLLYCQSSCSHHISEKIVTTRSRWVSDLNLVCRFQYKYLCERFADSVTIFGEIPPLWQNFNSLEIFWYCFGLVLCKLLYLLWQFLCYWPNFQSCKRRNVEK